MDPSAWLGLFGTVTAVLGFAGGMVWRAALLKGMVSTLGRDIADLTAALALKASVADLTNYQALANRHSEFISAQLATLSRQLADMSTKADSEHRRRSDQFEDQNVKLSIASTHIEVNNVKIEDIGRRVTALEGKG